MKGGTRKGAGRPAKPNKPKPVSWRPDSQDQRDFYIAMGGALWVKALIDAARERQENGK